MTTTAPLCRKCARSVRRLSTGRGSARPNIQTPVQTERQYSSFDAEPLLLMARIALGQHAGSSPPPSPSSAAAIKSP